MNYGSKHADMSAKSKDIISTAANSIKNQSNLKSLTKRGVLSRNINTTPLYIQPGYEHNAACLYKLQKQARWIIEQY